MFYLIRARSGRVINRLYPNLGIATISTVLEESGEEVRIFDLCSTSEEFLFEEMQSDQPEFIGFTTSIDDFRDVLRIANTTREVSPGSTVIFGGPHVSIIKKYAFNLSDSLDMIVIGEGEDTIKQIISYKNNGSIGEIPGVLYRNGNSEVISPIGNKPVDLNTIPMVNWKNYDLSKFFNILPVRSSVGCPHHCPYCGEGEIFGKKVRSLHTENLINSLDFYVETKDTNVFRFADSTFNYSKKRLRDINNAIIDARLDIVWGSYARFETLDEELVELSAEAGAVAFYFGVESGDDDILASYRNRYDWDHIKNILRKCEATGIHAHCNFMLGLPGETEQSVRNTINRIVDIKPNSFYISPFFVVPNTKIHLSSDEYGVSFLDDKWIEQQHNSFYNMDYAYFRHNTMSQSQMFDLALEATEELQGRGNFNVNLKDYPLLTWLSLGGNTEDLRNLWNTPEKILSEEELPYFLAFREKELIEVTDPSKMMDVLEKIATRLY